MEAGAAEGRKEKITGMKMKELDKHALIETACQDLLTYGVWDGRKRMKYLLRKYVLRRKAAPEDTIFWPTGLLAAGLWHCRQEAKREQAGTVMIDLVLEAYYDRWFGRGCPILWLDDLLAGETLLDIYEDYRAAGGDNGIVHAKNCERYRQAIEQLAVYSFIYPVNETGSFPYREDQDRNRIFVDSVGLACPFLYRYGVFCGRQEAMEQSVKQIVNFLAYGMDASTGLPYHGYSIADDCKYGIIGWGRAVGWLLRGMTGCMTTEYGRVRLEDSCIRTVDAALAFQRRDGAFCWQLQAVEGPADTSATGMICVALKQGIKLGILQEEKYERALQSGVAFIEKCTREGRVYQCSGECEGFGQYPQRYGAYPWALGTALML